MALQVGTTIIRLGLCKREQNFPLQQSRLHRSPDADIHDTVAAELTLVVFDGLHAHIKLP